MLITKEFIEENTTSRGSWTRSQIESLGIDWPPLSGWKKRVIGNTISKENADIFKSKIPAKLKLLNIDSELQSVLTRKKNLSDKALMSALKIIQKEIMKREGL